MTKSEIFKLAHAEARRNVKAVGDYAIAFKLALKAIYSEPEFYDVDDAVCYINDVLKANGYSKMINAYSDFFYFEEGSTTYRKPKVSFHVKNRKLLQPFALKANKLADDHQSEYGHVYLFNTCLPLYKVKALFPDLALELEMIQNFMDTASAVSY